MRGLLFLLSALFLLESTDGHTEYEHLSQHDQRIIDKAITQANEEHGRDKHLDFASILHVNPEKRMLNVILKPTSCDNTTPSVHQKDCKIQDQARPQVSCVECRGSMSCFLRKDSPKIKQKEGECLNPSRPGRIYLVGGGTLMSESEGSGMHERNKNDQGYELNILF